MKGKDTISMDVILCLCAARVLINTESFLHFCNVRLLKQKKKTCFPHSNQSLNTKEEETQKFWLKYSFDRLFFFSCFLFLNIDTEKVIVVLGFP